jgi:hypothetical protein
MVKEVSLDVIERESLLTSFFIGFSVTIDNGLPLVTRSFLVCCYTIMPVVLSNMNPFKFATLLGL